MSDEEIDYLTVEDLLEIAAGVIGEVAIRDAGLLAAAAGRPQLTVYGEDAYATLEAKAAALLHSLVRTTPWSTEQTVGLGRYASLLHPERARPVLPGRRRRTAHDGRRDR